MGWVGYFNSESVEKRGLPVSFATPLNVMSSITVGCDRPIALMAYKIMRYDVPGSRLSMKNATGACYTRDTRNKSVGGREKKTKNTNEQRTHTPCTLIAISDKLRADNASHIESANSWYTKRSLWCGAVHSPMCSGCGRTVRPASARAAPAGMSAADRRRNLRRIRPAAIRMIDSIRSNSAVALECLANVWLDGYSISMVCRHCNAPVSVSVIWPRKCHYISESLAFGM